MSFKNKGKTILLLFIPKNKCKNLRQKNFLPRHPHICILWEIYLSKNENYPRRDILPKNEKKECKA